MKIKEVLFDSINQIFFYKFIVKKRR
jgi:hypothetical protein